MIFVVPFRCVYNRIEQNSFLGKAKHVITVQLGHQIHNAIGMLGCEKCDMGLVTSKSVFGHEQMAWK